MKAAAYQALFGLLAVSGVRVGETLGLTSGHVDITALLPAPSAYLGHFSPASIPSHADKLRDATD